MYQAAGALVITVTRISGCDRYVILPGEAGWESSNFHDPLLDVAWLLGIIAWGIGKVMFMFGVFAPVFKSDDWVEDPRRQSIYLENSDAEEANVGLPPYHSD